MTRRKDPRSARLPVPAGELPAFAPVPRRCNRHDGWTPERQRIFIEALADLGSVEAAARAAGMSSVGAYQLRRQPGACEFRAAWEAALAIGVSRIEDVAMDRALNGTEEPVYSYGKLVGTRIKRNDGLLMFILRNRAPERFATGGARGMSALDKGKIARLKKQWEKEHAAKRRYVSAAEVRASIDRKIEAIRARVEPVRLATWALLSEETRAAWAQFVALRTRDLAALRADPETAKLIEVDWDAPDDTFEETVPPERRLPAAKHREPPEEMPPIKQWKKAEAPPEPEPKTRWTLKDESFEP